MKVELLYFDGCPSWLDTLENLRMAVPDDLHIDLVRVETREQAAIERFAGSPTIRVEGRDLFPADEDSYALACRMYQTPDGIAGAPTTAMLKAALSIHGYAVSRH